MWHSVDGMGWWMLIGSIWFVVFWGLVLWVVLSLVGRAGGGGARGDDSPVEIARRRYARGDITREEFEQIRRDLGS